jgi:hypothetical protein
MQVSLCRSWEQFILAIPPVMQSKNNLSSYMTIQQGKNVSLSINLLEVLPRKASSSQPKSW